MNKNTIRRLAQANLHLKKFLCIFFLYLNSTCRQQYSSILLVAILFGKLLFKDKNQKAVHVKGGIYEYEV